MFGVSYRNLLLVSHNAVVFGLTKRELAAVPIEYDFFVTVFGLFFMRNTIGRLNRLHVFEKNSIVL